MDPTTPTTPAGSSPTAAQPVTTTSATGKQYIIPQGVLDKYPDLVELIKKTESMSDDERNYWFQILPIMTAEQVNRLKGILQEEAAQLSKLDDQYQDQLAKLNQKHLEEWNSFQHKQDRAALQKAEAEDQAKEAASEEDLLKQLNQTDAGQTPNP
jgi:hypothetical protein